ncbi:MAG: DUF2288 family protein [Myxococcota bacterium]
MSELRAKIESEIMPTQWSVLAMHAKRSALFVVDSSLALADAALAVAADRKNVVEQWINAGLLRRPAVEEMARWSDETGIHFRSVVVQPFVLAQRLPTSAAN